MRPIEPTRLRATVPEHLRLALAAVSDGWQRLLGDRLVSIVLFGSVARGDAGVASDIDVLVVAGGFPRRLSERRRELLDEWRRVQMERHLDTVEWNLVTKTPEEACLNSPLYLDMVEDAVILFDRGHFFRDVLARLRERMRVLGSRRVFLPDGSWYWDLKPDLKFGDVVEL